MNDIRARIIAERKRDVEKKGACLGHAVPARRTMPIVPFSTEPFVICEVKRRSPSRGTIAKGLDAAAQAGLYVQNGIRSISCLTEENSFGGSLADLLVIKNSYPGIAVLRKDFLCNVEDIDVSWRAGADAVLLIAAVLEYDQLSAMYERTRELGMEALVELHDEEDVLKAKRLKCPLAGINSRDLQSFNIDPLLPVKIKAMVDWDCKLVYESGIHTGEQAVFAFANGFTGVLVGEAAVTDKALPKQLLEAASSSATDSFWAPLCKRKKHNKPLVKICGICSFEDARAAAECGADVLGFIFADSPRQAELSLLEECATLNVLKTAVVCSGEGRLRVLSALKKKLDEKVIHAVQFHGNETPRDCFRTAFPYYKALRLHGADDVSRIAEYRCPRVLVDAYVKGQSGGTGKSLDHDILDEIKRRGIPLWLAGGLGPDNVGSFINRYQPELIDASSRLESRPGKKDHTLLQQYFREIHS